MAKVNFNFHTHSNLCDGTASLQDMAASAYEAGFDTLGFSGHGFSAYDDSYCMSREATVEYCDTIKELKDEYANRMEILMGIEQDFGSEEDVSGFDYVIGSVHSIFPTVEEYRIIKAADERAGTDTSDYRTEGTTGNRIYGNVPEDDNFHGFSRRRIYYIDWDVEATKWAIDYGFSGDTYAYIERYFETVSMLPETTGCDIIGHFDLITKFNERDKWFDEENPRYIDAAFSALERIHRYNPNMIFEINTGAISRKYRTAPYPSLFILKKIHELGMRIMINSDSHSVGTLDAAFEQARELAAEAGFSEIVKLTADGEETVNI